MTKFGVDRAQVDSASHTCNPEEGGPELLGQNQGIPPPWGHIYQKNELLTICVNSDFGQSRPILF